MVNQPVYALAPQILFAVFQDGGVIFNLDTRESHCLNPTAASVVALLDGRRTVGTIVDTLSAENDEMKGVVKKDVDSFIEDIINRGWIYDK